jgi:hypothetical protein
MATKGGDQQQVFKLRQTNQSKERTGCFYPIFYERGEMEVLALSRGSGLHPLIGQSAERRNGARSVSL